MRMGLVFALLTIAFHMLMYFVHQPKGACGKLLGLLPGILLVALLLIKPVTSMMNVHYTQQWYTSQVRGLAPGREGQNNCEARVSKERGAWQMLVCC
jgi:hypothetical protein